VGLGFLFTLVFEQIVFVLYSLWAIRLGKRTVSMGYSEFSDSGLVGQDLEGKSIESKNALVLYDKEE
jgi:hypothetical protein